MKSLIIHPQDQTTDFLKPIYASIQNKTIITGGITKTNLRELIEIHDKVIMLGHGSPNGLLSVDQFPCNCPYIIDYTMVELLSKKENNIFVWCNADLFVRQYQLQGFFCGMFISEIEEAWYYNFHNLERDTIDVSNNGFTDIVSTYISESLDILYKNVKTNYALLAQTNPIAKFNLERLYLSTAEQYGHLEMLAKPFDDYVEDEKILKNQKDEFTSIRNEIRSLPQRNPAGY